MDCASAQGEYPPITGELRKLLEDVSWTEIVCHMEMESDWECDYDWIQSWRKAADNACDAIDGVHARLEAENARLKAERDSMAAALDMAEGEHDFAPLSHYMLLPKDADGDPIHVGDVMEWPDEPHDAFEVVGIGVDTLYYFDDHSIEWTSVRGKRHCQPDSWESIIGDALGMEYFSECDRDRLVAHCKALAGDAS